MNTPFYPGRFRSPFRWSLWKGRGLFSASFSGRSALFWSVLSLTIFWGQEAAADTRNFSIPQFKEQVLVPASTSTVWNPPSTDTVWIPPSTVPVWVPPSSYTEWVPAVTHWELRPAIWGWVHHDAVTTYVHHDAVTNYVHHDAVTNYVHHDAVTHTVHHDLEIGVTHYDEVSHTVHHDESTHTEYVEGYWDANWVDGYYVDVWVDGYYDYSNPSEANWVDGYTETVWVDGYWDDFWVDGYEYTVTDEEAWDETVIDSFAHDEYYPISPAYDEQVEDAPAYDEPVTTPAYDEPVVTPAYDEPVTTPAYDEPVLLQAATEVEVVDIPAHPQLVEVPGHYVNQEVPGHWDTITIPGSWSTLTTPAYYRTDTIPASTLSVNHDGQSITGLVWSTGRTVTVPAWITDFMDNPNWSLDEPEEGGDPDVTGALTPALAFSFSGSLSEEVKKAEQDQKRIRRGNGGWVLDTETTNLTNEDAMAAMVIYVLVTAQEMTRTRTNPRDFMVYITYEKLAMDTTAPRKVYTGRTSGWGTITEVLDRREAKHLVKKPDFYPAIPNTILVTFGWSREAYGATRGREQSVMDWHDLHDQPTPFGYNYAYSHSENARPTPFRAHGTRGVDRNSFEAYNYHDVAKRAFGGVEVWEFTGANAVITQYYAWPPPPPNVLLLPPTWRPPLTY